MENTYYDGCGSDFLDAYGRHLADGADKCEAVCLNCEHYCKDHQGGCCCIYACECQEFVDPY